jgi:hypothetical protein
VGNSTGKSGEKEEWPEIGVVVSVVQINFFPHSGGKNKIGNRQEGWDFPSNQTTQLSLITKFFFLPVRNY